MNRDQFIKTQLMKDLEKLDKNLNTLSLSLRSYASIAKPGKWQALKHVIVGGESKELRGGSGNFGNGGKAGKLTVTEEMDWEKLYRGVQALKVDDMVTNIEQNLVRASLSGLNLPEVHPAEEASFL